MLKRKILLFRRFNAAMAILVIVMLAAFFVVADIVSAQSPDVGINYAANLDLPNTDQDPRDLAVNIVRYLMTFLGLVAVVVVMYSGWLWMTSNGDPAKVDKAKKTLVNAVIGLVVIISAYAIIVFIINLFGAGIPGTGPGSNNTRFDPGGIGTIGNCTVENVYPEPGQTEVPRNTSIIVTFREPVNVATVITGNVRIYKNGADPEDPANWADFSTSISADNKTVVLIPDKYLGSPSEYLWYTVYMSNSVEKLAGGGMFSTCYRDFLRWEFEVSNRIDLSPPYVLNNDVFPQPDNLQDTVSSGSPLLATGTITVTSRPQVHAAPTFLSVTPGGGSNPATVAMDPGNRESGTLTVTIASDGVTASLNNGAVLLGGAIFAGDTVSFPTYLSLTVSGGVYTAGNSWTINGVTAEVKADTLTVGNRIYIFGTDIASNANNNTTAANIASALAANPQVTASASANVVTVTARSAGTQGNSINLDSSSLDIAPMAGGGDSTVNVTVNDVRDKARNAVIQINFNEAINPLTVSGPAADLSAFIRVVNVGTSGLLDGTWTISNRYRTVEFVSDNLCGVNGCGEKIYCLPGNSNLRVELIAATLADCGSPDLCSSRAPFSTCNGINCENTSGELFPMSDIALMNGIMDAALNSLDGDRSGDAEGPGAFYNENTDAGAGDNYQWSFWVNNDIDLTPPIINNLNPAQGAADVDLSDPILVNFSDLMMSNSLRTGWIMIDNGRNNIRHKLINIWSLSTQNVGYWIGMENIDSSLPLDGEMDYARVSIYHSIFPDANSFRSQVGSGVKDIYQNCFKPSDGPDCAATDPEPSCCLGTMPPETGSLGSDGNCP